MEKKILFVNGLFGAASISEPLGICVLASVVRTAGFKNVDIYDPCVEGDSIERAVERVLEYEPDILAISVVGTDSTNVNKFVFLYRLKNKKSIIVIGGHGPSLCPERFLTKEVAGVFIGEGEISIPIFMSAVTNNQNIHSVPGLAYKGDDGKIKVNNLPSKIEDLDELPFMARDTLILLKNKYGSNVTAQMISSRGCYMNCSYCSIKAFSGLQEGKNYRERSVHLIIEELKYLYNVVGVRNFRFVDDNFIPPRHEDAERKINSFCDGISSNNLNNINFHIQCRPDNLRMDILERLINVGMNSLFIGIESINQEDLDIYRRKGNPEETYRLMDELAQLDIRCNIHARVRLKTGYITFNPYSTRETLLNSLHFIQKYTLSPKKLLNYIRPYNKTPIYERFSKESLILPDNTIKFIDPEIGIIYTTYRETVRDILKFRDRIRFAIKRNRIFGDGFYTEKFEECSDKIEVICYDLFKELLASNISDFPNIRRKYSEMMNEIKSETAILDVLEQFEKDVTSNGELYTFIRNM